MRTCQCRHAVRSTSFTAFGYRDTHVPFRDIVGAGILLKASFWVVSFPASKIFECWLLVKKSSA